MHRFLSHRFTFMVVGAIMAFVVVVVVVVFVVVVVVFFFVVFVVVVVVVVTISQIHQKMEKKIKKEFTKL